MLTHLFIQNFVLVTRVEIDFHKGMTVLTGETGAGKSIIFDALGLATGKRAENRFIRSGCSQTEIVATFCQLTNGIKQWLSDQSIEHEDDALILRRVVRLDGPSRAYINGVPTSSQSLRELAVMLIDIQGQHAHQRLLKRDEQLSQLDRYASSDSLLEEMSSAYRHWHNLIAQRDELLQNEAERQDRIALLEFQLDELESVELVEGEIDELETEQQQLSNAEQLLAQSHQLYQQLQGDEQEQNILQQLHRALADLERLEQLDPSLQPIREQLNEATLLTDEIAASLRQQRDRYQLDPERLEWLNQRLSQLSDLGRKHRCDSGQLYQRQLDLQQQLDQLQSHSDQLNTTYMEIDQASRRCTEIAMQLHETRLAAANKLEQAVNQEIRQLGMEQGQFHINLTLLPEEKMRANGLDTIQYEIKTNTGSSFHPLSKIASGGELSRISLAILLAVASRGETPTLIFDEVDSGVGGGTADRIGQKLRQLGDTTQILCVTHLPQVAAQSHHHLRIEKQPVSGDTESTITPLHDAVRIEEIARMLGGVEITSQTLAHATEMVQSR